MKSSLISEEVLLWVDPGPGSAGASSADTPGSWEKGSTSLERHQTANLMVDSYGFASSEELSRVQRYLHEHGR